MPIKTENLKAQKAVRQQHLTAADQRIDELITKQQETGPERVMEIIERYPNGDPLQYDAAVNAARKNAK